MTTPKNKNSVCFTALFLFIGLVLGGCSSFPLKTIKTTEEKDIALTLISGNLNVERYKTYSNVKVYLKESADQKKKGSLTEEKLEKAKFDLNRKVISVTDKGEAQIKYWVNNVRGDVDLMSMGFPPKGKVLMEVLDQKAKVIAVKDVPEKTIFYLPKISLPENKVKVGDTWDFEQRWLSLKTGWPFDLKIKSTLNKWVECGGMKCMHITYKGYVKVPKESPVKEGMLKSEVYGEFVYSPLGHQFIWSYSTSKEIFITPKKQVDVVSCTASYQITPEKENKVFEKKYEKSCN